MIEIYILLCCSSELRVGPGVALFNFLADCVEDFVKKLGMENVEFSLGLHLNFDLLSLFYQWLLFFSVV